jgi:hypothetical protein
MTEHMLMVLEDEDAHATQSPQAMAELIEKRARFEGELRRAGVLRDSGHLRPTKEGKRVRKDGDALLVRNGPFAEEGRALGAYCWVETPNVEEAAKLAAGYPALPSDQVDVRPLMKGKVDADKDAKPGKLFAFAVLGNAATEDAWVKLMDRIDAETRGALSGPAFLGGVRLEPPNAGRRVATRDERRAMFDGPFLESKEVIGGLFFARMASIDEAIAWALGSRFVVHGTLEIRELWRT